MLSFMLRAGTARRMTTAAAGRRAPVPPASSWPSVSPGGLAGDLVVDLAVAVARQPAWPPQAAAEVEVEGGDQDRADDEGVEQHAEGDGEAELGEEGDGQGAQDGEGAGQDRAGGGDDPAGGG